jgi:hypothetical protein
MRCRMTIVLTSEEKEVLQALSAESLRWPREEIRYLIRKEGKRRGLLPIEQHETERDQQITVSDRQEAQR